MPDLLPAVAFRGIVKKYPRVVANDGIDLTVRSGTIHAIVGENGAGKSTLMKILYGLARPDSGEIHINGRPAAFSSPHDAIAAGIGMVHQHFMLVRPMTVYENVVLGCEPPPASTLARLLGVWNRAEARAQTQRLSKQYGIVVEPDARIEDISLGEQQRVEILKVLYRGAKIIILDEPTTVLTPQEANSLFAHLRRLRDTGTTIIFISHKLREVLQLCDFVTVLRRGKAIGTWPLAQITQTDIARQMLGEMDETEFKGRAYAGTSEEILRLEQVCTARTGRRIPLRDVSLTIRAGEVLGVYGVEGNGQRELAELACGMIDPSSGRLFRAGRTAYIPEDRRESGLLGPAPAWENMILGRHHDPKFSRPWRWLRGPIDSYCHDLIDEYNLVPPELGQTTSAFSGGNQQKIVVGREISKGSDLLIAAHPTRGVDLAATSIIHRKILEVRARGAGILLVSSDLDELLELSDRVVALFSGRIVGECPRSEVSIDRLGAWMTGAVG